MQNLGAAAIVDDATRLDMTRCRLLFELTTPFPLAGQLLPLVITTFWPSAEGLGGQPEPEKHGIAGIIAKEQTIADTHTIINLQGKSGMKYVVSYQFSDKPKRAKFSAGWPASQEDNRTRLAEAGVVMDGLVLKCGNCKELGHASKNCEQEKQEPAGKVAIVLATARRSASPTSVSWRIDRSSQPLRQITRNEWCRLWRTRRRDKKDNLWPRELETPSLPAPFTKRNANGIFASWLRCVEAVPSSRQQPGLGHRYHSSQRDEISCKPEILRHSRESSEWAATCLHCDRSPPNTSESPEDGDSPIETSTRRMEDIRNSCSRDDGRVKPTRSGAPKGVWVYCRLPRDLQQCSLQRLRHLIQYAAYLPKL
ncbi:uncharacterized protein MYCFIDRAFT_180412 [Pseudocercospora fijiensis CIRAD86]|uniref:CCHC-type domain-containing protein n=1 Tax=Pseudocercospora fijiensis (strain CIRAD86) TaxID=383855 RepID=M2ZD75_PSEFD|nr:uncharacterized protein MYCFIDRAFT_180412 [Pseudocercospora fijiensis CIRAD86]EME77079.1 hypothetical protein MYCFIDRAFT_180412 [Pseudocercospora fijiensis CIRAD86]